MAKVRLDLAYHGGGFAGWAAQPRRRTVEGVLTEALSTVFGERAPLSVAGRTDAGVHALGQVASFESPSEPSPELARALNGITDDDLAILDARAVAEAFDARRDARSRTYLYRLHTAAVPSPFERGLSLWWPHGVDREALDACAAALMGTHDFTAFTPTDTEHVRFERNVLRAEWVDAGSAARLDFRIEADAFMRNMVRVLVGTMLEVAGGRRDLAEFERLLGGAPRDAAGDTAQPHGLYLAGVRY
jgi:tRNA pseudouridine38-40 synthase